MKSQVSARRRPLRLEPLEGRRLLAVDLGGLDGSTEQVGFLGAWDRQEIYRFNIERDATVELTLDGLWRDADLALFDAGGRVVDVSARPGATAERITAELASGTYQVGVIAATTWWNAYRLELSAQLEPEAVPGEIGSDTEIDFDAVAPLPEVPEFGAASDWSVNAVGAPESWQAGYTGEGVTVAIVDSGVDLQHPDLTGQVDVNAGEIFGNGIDDDGNGLVDDVYGYDFVDGDPMPLDANGHGTHVAGTVAAANDGFGTTGIAPGAEILPIRVMDGAGMGTVSGVAAGIRYAADSGAEVINLSLGGGYHPSIDAAVRYAGSVGSLVIAAAGNSGGTVPGSPASLSAAYEHVLSVGAVDRSGRVAPFSNRVGTSDAVQVDAPGVDIVSGFFGGGARSLSGTSMAAPHVAGVAALALSANPALDAAGLRELIVRGATEPASGSDSVGMVDARTTVAYAAAGLPSASADAAATSPGRARVTAPTGVGYHVTARRAESPTVPRRWPIVREAFDGDHLQAGVTDRWLVTPDEPVVGDAPVEFGESASEDSVPRGSISVPRRSISAIERTSSADRDATDTAIVELFGSETSPDGLGSGVTGSV